MEQKHMFTNKMIADLLIPVVLEQLAELHHGNSGHDDGKQCGICGDFSSIAGGFDQCAGDPGVFCAGGRRCDRLCTVYRTEECEAGK